MSNEFYIGTGVFLLMVVSAIGLLVFVNWCMSRSDASWDAVKQSLKTYMESVATTEKELSAQLNVAQTAVMAEQSRYRELESAHEDLQDRYAKDMQAWRTENERLDKKLAEESHSWNELQRMFVDKTDECENLQKQLEALEKIYSDEVTQYKKEVQEAREMRSDYRKKLCRLLKCSETSSWAGLCSYAANLMCNVDKLKDTVLDLFDVEESEPEEELES